MAPLADKLSETLFLVSCNIAEIPVLESKLLNLEMFKNICLSSHYHLFLQSQYGEIISPHKQWCMCAGRTAGKKSTNTEQLVTQISFTGYRACSTACF